MSSVGRLVAYPVSHEDAGPLRDSCPVCEVPIGASCVVWGEPVPGDVRHMAYVRRQVLEFHAGRVPRE